MATQVLEAMQTPLTVSPLALVKRFAALLPGRADAGVAGVEAMLALAAHLGTSADPPEARKQLLEAALHLLAGERAFLLRLPTNLELGEVLASCSFDGEVVLHPGEKIIWPLVVTSRERQECFFTSVLESEPIFGALERARQPRTRSVLIVPLNDQNLLFYCDHRFQTLTFADQLWLQLGWLLTLLVQRERSQSARLEFERLNAEFAAVHDEQRVRGSSTLATLSGHPDKPKSTDDSEIIGKQADMLDIVALIRKVAPSQAPVHISGESGTGKELVARAIHRQSRCAHGAFVSENCAALSENLLEAELFGVVKGAYTGAVEDRPGLFELASGGTLFLDEIGDTSPGLQKKLLRVLQEGVIRRVGGQDLIAVDVRIISATHRNLVAEVEAGRFREDLFYRLNVISIQVPPLRERREDIPLLVEHFLDQLALKDGHRKQATTKLLSALMAYHWPGNIRELQNELRRASAVGGDFLLPQDLSPRITGVQPTVLVPQTALDSVIAAGSLKEASEQWEKSILAATLKRFNGNKARICAALKIPKTTLYARLRRYGLDLEEQTEPSSPQEPKAASP
ncbi:MAG: sigma-54 interaction domain-containing protein [Planctomycetota bacterium]